MQEERNPDGSNPFLPRRAVLTIVPAGNDLYVGTQDGVVSSSDRGLSWAVRDSSIRRLGVPVINAFARSESFGLAVATQDGLYHKISDSAYGQIKIETDDTPITAVAFAPSDTMRIYVGTDGKGVFVSDDAGVTWNPATGELGGKTRTVQLIVDPTNPEIVFARVLFERIYKSTDGGDSWHTVWTGMPVEEQLQSMAIAPGDPHILYAGGDTQFFASETEANRGSRAGCKGFPQPASGLTHRMPTRCGRAQRMACI